MARLRETGNTSALWLIAGLMILRVIAAACAGLAPDETYYWLWARHPAFGYFDHPPLVAWLIATSTALFGHSALAIRLPFLLVIAALTPIVWQIALSLFQSPRIARRAALWLNTVLLVSIGGILATPDPGSVLLWALALLALAKLQETGDGRWWLAFGLAAGLGIEAKYTGFFLGLGVLFWFVVEPAARRWLLSGWLWTGALLAALAMAPNLWWNATHHFATFEKQFGRLDAGEWTLRHVGEVIGAQIGLMNPLIAVFLCGAMGAVLRRSTVHLAACRLLLATSTPLLAYMLLHMFHARVEGNWPAPIYPALVVMAAAWSVHSRFAPRLAAAVVPFGAVATALAMLWLSLPASLFASLPDPAQLTRDWERIAAATDNLARASGADFVATGDYTITGEMAYHLRGKWPVYSLSEPQRYGWLKQVPDAGSRAAIIVDDGMAEGLARCFDALENKGLVRRGVSSPFLAGYVLFTGVLKSGECLRAQ